MIFVPGTVVWCIVCWIVVIAYKEVLCILNLFYVKYFTLYLVFYPFIHAFIVLGVKNAIETTVYGLSNVLCWVEYCCALLLVWSLILSSEFHDSRDLGGISSHKHFVKCSGAITIFGRIFHHCTKSARWRDEINGSVCYRGISMWCFDIIG